MVGAFACVDDDRVEQPAIATADVGAPKAASFLGVNGLKRMRAN